MSLWSWLEGEATTSTSPQQRIHTSLFHLSPVSYTIRNFSKQIALHAVSCWFLEWLSLILWRCRRYVPSKRRFASTGLQGVISPKTELLIKDKLWLFNMLLCLKRYTVSSLPVSAVYENRVFSESHMKLINSLCVQTTKLLMQKQVWVRSSVVGLRTIL
jgi:hypothetical protein